MPFAVNGSLVATHTHRFGEVWVLIVYLIIESEHAIGMTVLACQYCGSAGRADRIRDIAMVETNSLVSKTIDVRRVVDASSIRRNCLGLTIKSVTISSSSRCLSNLQHGRPPA